MKVNLIINGASHLMDVAPGETLLELLRREGYKSVKKGCGTGDCGACAVLLNGRAVNSCLVLAAKADGAEVKTIEGVLDGDSLHPVQQAFLDCGAVQCGYCTPSMVLTTIDFLSRNPDPTDDDIRAAISGNLCRCTGYEKQVEAIRQAAAAMRGGPNVA